MSSTSLDLAGDSRPARRTGPRRRVRRADATAAWTSPRCPTTSAVERPRNPEHGDYATNVALRTAKKAGVAAARAGRLAGRGAGRPRRASPAPRSPGPGFINLRLAADAQGAIVGEVLAAGEAYGTGDELRRAATSTWSSSRPTRPARCTSAAPGGPRSATRWAGCSPRAGAKVTREYYFNDAGAQIDRFVALAGRRRAGRADPGERLRRRLHRRDRRAGASRPSPGALDLPDAERDEVFRRVGVGLMFDEIKRALHEFGTDFDVYFHEQSLHDSGAVDAAVDRLQGVRAASTTPTARGGCAPPTSATTRTASVIKSDGTPGLHRRRPRLLPGQAGARLRPVHLHARRRPPRLHRPAQGRRGRVRRRPGRGRGADRAAGQPGQRRRSRCG